MPLAVGTKAPDFTLSTKTADGPKQIKLSNNFGKKNTLLLFFPMAFTGTCTTEMCATSKELPSYSGLNTEVYGISGDNPFAQEAWAQKEKMGGAPKRSAFIIDKTGVIQYAESNDDAKQLPNFDKIKAKLAELK